MLPDRVSNPGPLTYESGAPTNCATRPGGIYKDSLLYTLTVDIYKDSLLFTLTISTYEYQNPYLWHKNTNCKYKFVCLTYLFCSPFKNNLEIDLKQKHTLSGVTMNEYF